MVRIDSREKRGNSFTITVDFKRNGLIFPLVFTPHYWYSPFMLDTTQPVFNWKNTTLILATAVSLLLFYNFAFFRNIIAAYPLTLGNSLFIGSIALLLLSLITILLTLVSSRHIIKPALIIIVFVSSFASYFMDSYNVVIDTSMIENIFSTNFSESLDLFSLKLFIYIFLLGILPSLFIYKLNISYCTLKKEFITKMIVIFIALAVVTSQILIFSKSYSSLFREQKILRYYANPVTYIHSSLAYLNQKLGSSNTVIKPVGQDAKIPASDNDRELVILVIGETARADRFSLNGYSKQTNPLLEKEQVVSFKNVASCGTATAVSVPCMFSMYTRDGYSDEHARDTENLLDVLHHAGITILWRDNNSDSKSVALRVPYQDYKSPDVNPVCDEECRDEGMLVGLQEFIEKQTTGDIFIILHSMGNHGPAYYKRYPKLFEKFTPACHTNQLENCTNEEINNAYDNAILYTDYFLSKVINLLKHNDDKFETAMLYMSDHGESLGENNLYLHGLPYILAPNTQKYVAAVLWLGERFYEDGLDINAIKTKADNAFSHDNLFHTILGLMELETADYDKELDILSHDREKY
jgi:lipid A ethanolaminephosphotransferase